MPKIKAGYKKTELPGSVGRIGGILLAAGLLLGALSFLIEPSRAAFSYLTTFMFLVSIAVGSLFLVALEYAAGAAWSTPFRRISEFLSVLTPILIVLVIPLLFSLHNIFHWSHAEAVESDNVLSGKLPYLNIQFFIIRAAAIFIIWSLFYMLITKNSRKQDDSKDQNLTTKNIKLSIVFIVFFAFSISIAAIDWMMSIEPHWFSTIFGVYYFSGTVWAALAALTLIAVMLQQKGLLHSGLNDDHFYSLGTLLFAFTAFWGYIAFSQYMLIWYADLPEETTWFFHRWEGGWAIFSVVLILVHFVVPFFALLSHKAKTDLGRLKFISIWILFAHFYDVYWVIMPGMLQNGLQYSFNWSDIVFPIFGVGLVITIFNLMVKKYNLIPVGDPKLQRGLDFHL